MKVRLSFVCYEPSASFLRRSTVTPRIIPQWLTKPLFAARPVGCPPRPPPGQKANRLKPLRGTGVTAVIAAASQALPLPPIPLQPEAAFDPEP